MGLVTGDGTPGGRQTPCRTDNHPGERGGRVSARLSG